MKTGLVMAVALLCAACSKQSDVIDTKTIRLRDDEGQVRALLTSTADQTTLSLYRSNGATGAGLMVDDRQSALSIFNGDGKPIVIIASSNDSAYISILDTGGEPKIALVCDKEGSSLSLFDEDGLGGASLSTYDDGSTLLITDHSNKPVLALGSRTRTRFVVFDENREPFYSIPESIER